MAKLSEAVKGEPRSDVVPEYSLRVLYRLQRHHGTVKVLSVRVADDDQPQVAKITCSGAGMVYELSPDAQALHARLHREEPQLDLFVIQVFERVEAGSMTVDMGYEGVVCLEKVG